MLRRPLAYADKQQVTLRGVLHWRKIDAVMLLVVMLVAGGARSLTLARPFHRDPEGCGCFYGTLARNYFRYGVTKYFAVPIQSTGVTPKAPVFYPNHPPLLPLLIAAVYKISGWNACEWRVPARLADATVDDTAFTIACVVTIFVLLRSRANLRAATIAAIIFRCCR